MTFSASWNATPLGVVTTGLVPVVHGMLRRPMDCRDKPGNDDGVGMMMPAASRDSRFRGNDAVIEVKSHEVLK